ncbi:MAG: DUF11 domain-containing protein [Chloroflexi bacterium]|nr:DUF11 domain-containing protein [Chloroflexota bacterium]
MKYKSLTLTTIITMLINLVGAGLAPMPAAAALSTTSGLEAHASSSYDVVPSWFAATADSAPKSALPTWFTGGTAARVSSAPPERVLPVKQMPSVSSRDVLAAPLPRPLTNPIPQLSIEVEAPANVSEGDEAVGGNFYTVTVRNNSPSVSALNFYITATIPMTGFTYIDGSADFTSVISGVQFVVDTPVGKVVTWRPIPSSFDLLPGDVVVLTFKMQTDGTAVSGQRLDVNAVYENPADTQESLNAGQNVRVGRGNLVISKSPSIRDATLGDEVSWEIIVANTGLGDVYTTTITDTFGIGYINTDDGELTTIPLLSIGERRSFNVTATVNSCTDLTNIAEASWSIGNEPNREGQVLGTSAHPVSDTTDVAYLLETPNVSIAATGDINIGYCGTPVAHAIVVTVSNVAGAGAAADFVLVSDMDPSYSVGAVDSNWTYNNGIFTLTANSGVLAAGNEMALSFMVTPPLDVCGGAFSQNINFEARYSNGCNLDYTGPSTSVSYDYATGSDAEPTLSVAKTVDDEVTFTDDTAVFTISFTAENGDNIDGDILITDSIPTAFTNTTIINTSDGSTSIVDNQLVWTIPSSPGNISGTLSFSVTVVDADGVCGANTTVYNTVDAFAETDCASCDPLTSTASVDVIIQNSPTGEPGGGISSHAEVCGDNFTITNTYQISITSWSGIIFTDTLGTRDVPAGSLAYVASTLSVIVNGVDRIGDVTIVQTLPQLVVDLGGIGAPTGIVTVTISYDIDPDEDFLESQAQQRIFNWSEFHVPGSGSGACTGDDTFYQGVWIDLQRADLQIDISPQSFDGCQTVPVTLTVSDPDFVSEGLTATNVIVTFQAAAGELATINIGAMNYGAGFAGGPTSGPILSGTDTLVWTFDNGFAPGAISGTISFEMQRGCGNTTLSSTVTFADRCSINHTNSGGVAQPPRTPDLVLFVTPDTYMVNEKTARWRAYVTNVGDATAVTATLQNIFGAGFQFITQTTNMTSNLTLLNPAPFTPDEDIVWQITDLAPGEQMRIDIYARVVSCGDVEATVRLNSDCLGFDCSAPQEKVLNFIQPVPEIRSSNDQSADLPLCSTGEVLLRVKNAAVSVHMYNTIVSETITSLSYISGSTRMTVTDKYGDPIPELSNIAFEPVTSTVPDGELLVWRVDKGSPELSQTLVFTDRGPEETIDIHFMVQTGCDTPDSNKVQATAAAHEPCGNFFFRDESAETLDSVEPEITLIKEARNATQGDSNYAQVVYGEPGNEIEWRVTAVNAVGAFIAHNVVVTDTLPPEIDLTSVFSHVTTGTASLAGNIVRWVIGDLPANNVNQTMFLTTTIKTSGVTCSVEGVNRAKLTYGCDDNCVVVPPLSAEAILRKLPNFAIEIPTATSLNLCGGPLTITLDNNGSTAHYVVVTDTLPLEYVYDSSISMPPGATVSPTSGSNVLVWEWISLTHGIHDIVFNVRQNATSGVCSSEATLENQVQTKYQNSDFCVDPITSTTSPTSSVEFMYLEIDKSPEYQVVGVGETVTWTVVVTNPSPGDMFNLIVTDTAGTQYENLSEVSNSTGVISNPISPNMVTWNITVTAGQTWAVTLTAILTETGTNDNRAELYSKCSSGCEPEIISDTAYVSLLNNFDKLPQVQTGTIGSLVFFNLEATLSDFNGYYENIVITDALPVGLGYVSSVLTYTVDIDTGIGGPTQTVTTAPLPNPGQYNSGDVVWSLGDLPGSIEINGIITAVIQDELASYDDARLVNEFQMAYVQDGGNHIFTTTANVDVVEPVMHIGKSYVTPEPCGATLLADSFNVPDTSLGTVGNWARTSGDAAVQDGMLRLFNSGDVQNPTVFSDFSISFMARKNDNITSGTDPRLLIQFRRQSSGRYNLEWQPDGDLRLYRSSGSGAFGGTEIQGLLPERWYHFEIRAQGNRIQVYVDGQQVFDDTDDNFQSGVIQIRTTADSDFYIDDILVTRFGEAGCIVAGNDLVTYTLAISNQAQLPGHNLVITDALPNWMSLVTYTMDSNDPSNPAIVTEPSPGDDGTLVWSVDHLTPTAPFDPLNHTAITLTVVLRVADNVPANTILPNQASLDYTAWPAGPEAGEEREYSGGSHSTAVRTIDGEIGDYVWVDEDIDGIQDGGETPIPFVVVDLYNSTTGAFITTTTTDGGGLYLFENLPLNKSYTVQLSQTNFSPGGVLYAYTATLLHQGASGTDSNADPTATFNGSGYAVTTTLTFSPLITQDLTLDFGFYAGRIGDYVWIDENLNGTQDGGSETPIQSVIVDLYDSNSGNFITTTTTNPSGLYLFENLPLNVSYTVQLSQTNFDPGGALYAYTATLLGGMPFVNTDSNADPTALFNSSGYAVTTTLTTLITEDLTLDFGFYRMDLGDLPEGPYPTTLAQNGARHIILPADNPTLGATVDAELNGRPNETATGDDNADAPDDEDGVRLNSQLVAGQIATFTITGTNVISNPVLNAWIDFDGDSDFDDLGEQIFTDTVLALGANVLNINVPPVLLSDTLNSRFRYSTDAGLTITGQASDGEIEDHQFFPTRMDLGDLPEGPYLTTFSQDGARHVILPASNPTLGATVDDEVDGQPSSDASGDDATGVLDDEDGVRLESLILSGQTATMTITGTNVISAHLNAWIDFNGNGILTDPGDQIFSDATLDVGANILTFSVPAVVLSDTLNSRFRYSTDGGLIPTGEASDGEIEDHQFTPSRADFGDLPESPYPTTLAQNGPWHIILPTNNPILGAIVDAEIDGQPNGTATGDDTLDAPDDEDGVRLESPIIAGQIATMTITGTNASSAFLNAWIDFDGDGDLSGLGEQIFINTALTTGTNVLTFSVPAIILSDTLNSRFRYSTIGGLTPTGQASDGEIEDHQFAPTRRDLGDLPDGLYPTTLAQDGARHIILDANNPTLGASVDDEADGQPNITATGDDAARIPDDEDGMRLESIIVAGQIATMTITGTNVTSAVLNAWIDFDGDGDLSGLGEQIFINTALTTGTNVLTFSVPMVVLSDTLNSRFRYSTDTGLAIIGEASDGEIEDHQFHPFPLDMGDLPEGPYPTTLPQDGARHMILPLANPTLGATVDDEIDGQPSSDATGDDLAGATDDEDGVRLESPIIAGQIATMTITGTNVSGAYLNAWIDFDGDGILTGLGEQIFVNTALTTGTNVLTFGVPSVTLSDTLNSRFRYSTNGGLTPTGLASDGEIEDHQFAPTRADYGDLPEGPYPTTLAQNGAHHIILPVNNPTLGATVDDEVDGQPSINATGDDVSGTPDDEDGVRLESPIISGQTATMTISGTNASGAVLNAWIDFNGNGSLTDPGDQIFTDTTLVEGTNVLTFSVPAIILSDTLNSRFRYSTIPGLTPTGQASDGEIEDYQFSSILRDYGDLPEGPYPVTLAQNGARHIILPVSNPTLGATVDHEEDGQPSATATGDDISGTPDDEDGVRLETPIIAGQIATMTITGTNTSGAYLNAWIDFNGNGDLDDAGEQIFTDQTLAEGANVLAFNVPLVVLSNTLNSRFRYSTNTGITITGETSDGEIEDHQFAPTRTDLGDLPEGPYPTSLAQNGPWHIILDASNPTLGATVDAEIDGQPSATATDDDASGVPDDEDGVRLKTPIVAGQIATMTITGTNASGAVLNAWIDFNGNGSLTDPGDQIFTDTTLAEGANVLAFNVPLVVLSNTLNSRFRYSTITGLTPTGSAIDGEIEDHQFAPTRTDLGDLEEPPYPTTLAQNGARHLILPANNPTLGATVDDEVDGQPNSTATGDDDSSTPDDEDGVRLETPLISGQPATMIITGTNTSGAYLNAWIDFNGNGTLDDAGEQIFTDTTLSEGANVLVINVPLVVLSHTLNSRFRYSTVPSLTITGYATDGEIEDHQFAPFPRDFGDLEELPYPTTLAHNGARHIVLPVDNPTLGAIVDTEIDGQPSGNATDDDDSGTSDDEDGVRLETPLISGQPATTTITATNASGAYLNAWIDFNGNGTLDNTGEQIFTNQTLSEGANVLVINVPAVVLSQTLNSRFRYSTVPSLTIIGEAIDGEIEDHQFAPAIEFGDLPEAPYPTTLAQNGARHVVDGVTFLGSLVDVESDGQPSINADGDDTFDGSDDEDGVIFVTPLMRAQTAEIQVTAGSDGYLNAWIDFDGDGILDMIAVIAIDGTPIATTINDVFLSAGTHTFTINVPNVTIANSVYSRFRFTSYDPSGGLSYTGLASDGEVEDYVLMSLGNFVWLDDGSGGGTFNDGALNGSETGISNVAVELYQTGQTPGVDAPITTTATDASGYYIFTGLTPGIYVVHIPASEFGDGEPLKGLASSTGNGIPDDDDDQQVDENGIDDPTPVSNGISSGQVTLSLGGEPTSEDGDPNSNLTVDFGFYLSVEMELTKTVAPTTTVPGMPFTYTIRITNTGQLVYDPLALTDTLPSPDFNYIVGSGSPSDPDVIAEPLLVWQNLGPLDPGGSVTVTFVVTVTPPNMGDFVNLATASGTTPSGTITSTTNATVTIAGPVVQVIKQLAGWDRQNNVMTFTIDVINAGFSALDIVPLEDDYNYNYLSFASAQPHAPVTVYPAPDGRLLWNDLTGPSNGFGYDLLPNERFVITTVFDIIADITHTVDNTAIVSGPVDVHTNQAGIVTSTVIVNNIPTDIDLLYLRAAGQGAGVLVEWATVRETNVYGFQIRRAAINQISQAESLTFQTAQGDGYGAEYVYLDRDADPTQSYWYWLVAMGNAGGSANYGPVSSSVLNLAYKVYLPVIIK